MPAFLSARRGPSPPPPAADPYPVLVDLLDRHLREIRGHIRLEISGGIMHLVEQLLLAGLRGDGAAGAFDLGDDEAAILADFADRKAEPGEIFHVLEVRIGEVAAGDLAGTFQQMTGNDALAEQIPVIHYPAKEIYEQREKKRRIGG